MIATLTLALAAVAAGAPPTLVLPEPAPHMRAELPREPVRYETALEVSAWAVVGASAADAITTELGVRSPDFDEGNALLGGSTASRLAIKAGTTALVLWLTRKLARSGREPAALGIRLGVAGTYATVAAYNTRAIR